MCSSAGLLVPDLFYSNVAKPEIGPFIIALGASSMLALLFCFLVGDLFMLFVPAAAFCLLLEAALVNFRLTGSSFYFSSLPTISTSIIFPAVCIFPAWLTVVSSTLTSVYSMSLLSDWKLWRGLIYMCDSCSSPGVGKDSMMGSISNLLLSTRRKAPLSLFLVAFLEPDVKSCDKGRIWDAFFYVFEGWTTDWGLTGFVALAGIAEITLSVFNFIVNFFFNYIDDPRDPRDWARGRCP